MNEFDEREDWEIALEELIRQGRVVKKINDEGEEVFTLVQN